MRTLRTLVFAALLSASSASLAGCSATPDSRMDVTFDPCAGLVVAVDGGDAAQRSSVDAAVALWNASGPLRLSRDENPDLPRLSVSFQKAALAFRGVYDDERGLVVVNDDLASERTRTITVAHELGHAFGLWHTSAADGASVMKADNVDVGPTARDVARLEALWESCASANDAGE